MYAHTETAYEDMNSQKYVSIEKYSILSVLL